MQYSSFQMSEWAVCITGCERDCCTCAVRIECMDAALQKCPLSHSNFERFFMESVFMEASLLLSVLEVKWQEQRQGVSKVRFGADEVSEAPVMERAAL